jgi:ABC-2 type transport system ATP-binding protein/lipopolysaccharide transport system ATP-binding protein
LSSGTPAIIVEGVGKRYRLGEIGGADFRRAAARVLRRAREERPTLWALRDVDLQIDEGEVVGIIGRNGAGKSTLLKILARITEPTVGVSRTRGRVGALLEVGTGFHPELTGRENVFLNGAILGMSTAEVRQRFDEIIDFAGVDRFVDTPLKRYSSGMELRLAFAVAAHFEPDVIVVDEVLAVGDAEFQRRCLGRMSELTEEGRTVLFVTHDHGAMARLVSRVVWLEAGEVVADGPAPEVLRDYLGSVPAVRAGQRIAVRRAGAVVVRSVDVFSQAEQRRIDPVRGSPLHLSVSFELTESVTGLDVGFYLKSEDGTWLLNEAWSDDHGAMPVDRPGEYTATLVVPAMLTAGRYTLALWMGSPYETLIDEDVASFDVVPRLEDRQEAVRRPRTMQPAVKWELSRS